MRYLKYCISLVSVFFMIACGDSSGSAEELPITAQRSRAAVWICHHPNTEFHDKECVESVYPDGCYSSDGTNAYCWLLSKGHCEIFPGEFRLDWQKKYCPLLVE